MHANFSSDLVEVICIADSIDFEEIERRFAKSFIASRYRDALHFDLPKGHVFIFSYGVVVAWGVSEAKKTQLMKELSHFASAQFSQNWETYKFSVQPDASITISHDVFTLPAAKTHHLLAISHALAQSRKLELFENQAQEAIDSSRELTEQLSQSGTITVSRQQFCKLRGALFATKRDIMQRFNLLEVPAYFWDYPATQDDYVLVSRYLELTQRQHLLNLKLQTLHELFDTVATEQQHKHWSHLKWLIILLIAVQVVLLSAH